MTTSGIVFWTTYFGIAAAVMLNDQADIREQQQLRIEYCENVDLWHRQAHLPPESRWGHPDYDDIYDTACWH